MDWSRLSARLSITVTSCPSADSCSARVLPTLPSPTITIFIYPWPLLALILPFIITFFPLKRYIDFSSADSLHSPGDSAFSVAYPAGGSRPRTPGPLLKKAGENPRIAIAGSPTSLLAPRPSGPGRSRPPRFPGGIFPAHPARQNPGPGGGGCAKRTQSRGLRPRLWFGRPLRAGQTPPPPWAGIFAWPSPRAKKPPG